MERMNLYGVKLTLMELKVSGAMLKQDCPSFVVSEKSRIITT